VAACDGRVCIAREEPDGERRRVDYFLGRVLEMYDETDGVFGRDPAPRFMVSQLDFGVPELE